MMIPIGLRATEQFLRGVPNSLREGSLALGASQTRTIFFVVVPAAKQGILTGMILGVARVAGETAPLLFTSLNNQFWANSLNEPTASLPAIIYKYAISPYEDLHRQAWAAGLLLLVLVLVANIASRWVLSRGGAAQRA
jgi:phosphate transport system permease protein